MGNASSCASGGRTSDDLDGGANASLFTTAGMQLGASSDATTAAAAGNIPQLTALLKAHPHALTHQSLFTHRTLAHAAAEAGQLQALLATIAFVSEGLPTIQHAVLYTSAEAMGLHTRQQLVSYILSARTVKGLTPLMLAAFNGHAPVVKLLLHKGCDPWQTDRFGTRNALHYAALGGHADCVKALLDFVPRYLHRSSRRYVDSRTLCGYTSLMCAAARGHLAAVNAILSYEPHVNYASSYESIVDKSVKGVVSRSTPLHVACMHNQTQVALALLLHYAQRVGRMRDTRTLLDINKRQPCDVAAQRGHRALAALMQPDVELTSLFNPLQLAPVVVPTLASLAASAVRSHLTHCIDAAEKVGAAAAAPGLLSSVAAVPVPARSKSAGLSRGSSGGDDAMSGASGSGSSSASSSWLAGESNDRLRPLPVVPFPSLIAFPSPAIEQQQQPCSLPLLSPRNSAPLSPIRISGSGTTTSLSRSNSGIARGAQLPRRLAPPSLNIPGSGNTSPTPTPRRATTSRVARLPSITANTIRQSENGSASPKAAVSHTSALHPCSSATSAASDRTAKSLAVRSASAVQHAVLPGTVPQQCDLQELCEPGLLPQEVKMQQQAAAAAAAAADAAEADETLPLAARRSCGGGAAEDDEEYDDAVCGVCFDRAVCVRVSGCGHQLCGGCAREMVGRMLEKPLACPFCRGDIKGFGALGQ